MQVDSQDTTSFLRCQLLQSINLTLDRIEEQLHLPILSYQKNCKEPRFPGGLDSSTRPRQCFTAVASYRFWRATARSDEQSLLVLKREWTANTAATGTIALWYVTCLHNVLIPDLGSHSPFVLCSTLPKRLIVQDQ